MEFTKLIITSDLAHFKNGIGGKNQNTFKCPPISTVVGILKNIYDENIQDFIFGYTCEYNGTFKDASTIYKEISPTAPKSKRFSKDICFIEYLVNPIITIYTSISKEPIIKDILNLGKTNCLAKCTMNKENIINNNSIGYNQWTPKSVGSGIIQRINKETKYNKQKGFYDYYTELLRFNEEFESKYTTEITQEGIQLWIYKGDGKVECYQEKL